MGILDFFRRKKSVHSTEEVAVTRSIEASLTSVASAEGRAELANKPDLSNREVRNKILGLTEEEKEQIKREVLEEIEGAKQCD